MKIISYSDLHLEFGKKFCLPDPSTTDLMVLAGDIITFRDYEPLDQLLSGWNKPVLYVIGNHEYYTKRPMDNDVAAFHSWLTKCHPNVTLLQDEATEIDGVHFFGGTMWTNFADANPIAIASAKQRMVDYRRIMLPNGEMLKPADTIKLHQLFVTKINAWFNQELGGPRVVITHCAPVINPHSRYADSSMLPAFNSLDMLEVIEKYQPNLWIYGHTHEYDDQTIGHTQIISNPRGYPNRGGGFECAQFDPTGNPVSI